MADKQKIAFVCHPYHRGGVTRWMADAALAYTANGHEVYFVTVEPAKAFFLSEGRETLLELLEKETHNIRIITTKVGREYEFGTPAYRAYIYKKLMVSLPPDTPVILSDDTAIWEAAAFLHNTYPMIGVMHADEASYYNLAEKYFRKAAVFVCVSDRISKTIREKIPGFDPSHIHTILCGINLSAPPQNIHTGDILQLVYTGRVSEFQKRVGDLVKISAFLAKNNTHFRLTIVGDGDTKIPLENKFKEAGLQQFITFTGWRSQKEIEQYLSESDILLLTSGFEGMPIAMMEALAAGCGVAGTRVSGIEDYENHPLATDCLAVYTVGDIEDAVNKINKLAAIPRNIKQQAARQLAESEFNMQVCLDKYVAAISQIPPHKVAAPPVINLSPTASLYSNALAIARSLKVRYSR